MREAVIVSTARTPIGRAYKGAFNDTKSPTLMGHALRAALERAGVLPVEIEDVVIGTVLSSGTAGMNLARYAALAAGFGVATPGQTMDRQCASGLMAIATAAKQIVVDGMDVVVAGGQENISAEQKTYFEAALAAADPGVVAYAVHAYMPMLKTAEFVAAKYGISRSDQDAFAILSQQRVGKAQREGLFSDEIVPVTARMQVQDKTTGAKNFVEVTIDRDEGARPDTTLEGLAKLKPVIEGGCITAGNASQLSDGASACVLMEGTVAARRGLKPLGLPALDMLRIEAGLVFANYEFSDETDPFEAGIGFTVPLRTKSDDFIGKAALVERQAHPRRKLVGLEMDGNDPVGQGDCVHIGRAQIGIVTSATRSPILKKTIALARVDVVHSEIGTELEVGKLDGHQKRLPARIVRFPHYDPEKTRVRS